MADAQTRRPPEKDSPKLDTTSPNLPAPRVPLSGRLVPYDSEEARSSSPEVDQLDDTPPSSPHPHIDFESAMGDENGVQVEVKEEFKEWSTRLQLLNRYMQISSKAADAEKQVKEHTALFRSVRPTAEQLQSHNKNKAKHERIRAGMVRMLNSAVAEFAQSGLWHLAADDASLNSHLVQKFEEMKGMIDNLKAATLSLHAQAKSKKRSPLPPPPRLRRSRSGTASSMDLDSDEEGSVSHPKKRRRISREASESTGRDEDAIEDLLNDADESLTERFTSMESKLDAVENLANGLQSDLSQELKQELEDEVKVLKTSAEKRAEELESQVTAMTPVKAEVAGLDRDVRGLTNEVVEQIHRNNALEQENTRLKAELAQSNRMMEEIAASRRDLVERSRQDIEALTAQVALLVSQRASSAPATSAGLSPELLQQITQLMQGNDILPDMKQRIRQEVLHPALDEHRNQTAEQIQQHQTAFKTVVMSKVENMNGVVQMVCKWADKVKMDVDPGLLLPPSEASSAAPSV
ncbi:hypothetical protein EIP91_009563 [Steccherinum ochraceum]|uniref:Uncharacterized protein n=1 Tax=Steccherinum ochraceum TaxID=92696 RepID=A0A4R0RTE2_9APHY|nr:hypothetical protein EIP91_009563 [Steccherinum ochraceum]